MNEHTTPSLSDDDLATFVADGCVRLRAAFPRALAAAGRALLWDALDADADDPTTWTAPVVRLDQFTQPVFREAANTPRLHMAFDQLVGPGRWRPQGALGTWPVRFPSDDDPGDAGWHVEASWAGDDGDLRLDVHSTGRALLMLFLFSDVGEDDAPTRVRLGSHLDVAGLLAPAGAAGREFFEFAAEAEAATADRPEAVATGDAGDVWLCHPFLVHAAQPHRGTHPKFMAQPPLLPTARFTLDGPSPVEQAIRRGLDGLG